MRQLNETSSRPPFPTTLIFVIVTEEAELLLLKTILTVFTPYFRLILMVPFPDLNSMSKNRMFYKAYDLPSIL